MVQSDIHQTQKSCMQRISPTPTEPPFVSSARYSRSQWILLVAFSPSPVKTSAGISLSGKVHSRVSISKETLNGGGVGETIKASK